MLGASNVKASQLMDQPLRGGFHIVNPKPLAFMLSSRDLAQLNAFEGNISQYTGDIDCVHVAKLRTH